VAGHRAVGDHGAQSLSVCREATLTDGILKNGILETSGAGDQEC
jgi:hypothetical protein